MIQRTDAWVVKIARANCGWTTDEEVLLEVSVEARRADAVAAFRWRLLDLGAGVHGLHLQRLTANYSPKGDRKFDNHKFDTM